MSLLLIPPAPRSLVPLLLPVFAGLLVAVALLGLGVGAISLPVSEIGRVLAGLAGLETLPAAPRSQLVLLEIRLPRVLMGALVGAGLAVAGAAMQGLFRNPLADPDLIGVSAGAACAAAGTIFFGPALLGAAFGLHAVPVAAFIGGIAALLLVWQIGGRGPDRVATMLLAGLGIGAIARACLGTLSFLSNDQQLRDITFWTLGSLGGASWSRIQAAAPLIILALALLHGAARRLDALALGVREAQHLGVDVEKLARQVTWAAALAVGGAVAVSGPIGFVGLAVPHVVRMLAGPGHRLLLPLSALLGASLLIAADMLARTVVSPAELPVGIVTAVLGTPIFIWLLIQRRRAQEGGGR